MTTTVIALDGPAGSGKSTVAKLLAEKLHYLYMDTGAMYRAISYQALQLHLDLTHTAPIVHMAHSLKLTFINNRVHVNGVDVAEQIRKPEVNNIVSSVASIPDIRHILIQLQREIAREHNVVMEGRDIGSVVFPDAQCKFYLEASVAVRAQRRYQETRDSNPELTLEQITDSIAARDHADQTRKVSPLIKAEDAIEVDTSQMSIEDVVDYLFDQVKLKLSNNI